MGKFRKDRRNVRRTGRRCRGFLIGIGVQTNCAHVRTNSCCSRLLGFRMGVRSCRVLARSDVHPIADLSIVSHPQLRSAFLVCDRISISIQPCTDKPICSCCRSLSVKYFTPEMRDIAGAPGIANAMMDAFAIAQGRISPSRLAGQD
jgi:hypothetical protein